MKKFFLALSIIPIFLCSCSSEKYDEYKCDTFIHDYSWEGKYKDLEDSDGYDRALREMPQATYSEIIAQILAMVDEMNEDMKKVESMSSHSAQVYALEQYTSSTIFEQFLILNGLIDDARSRGLLNDKNIEDLKSIPERGEDIDRIMRRVYRFGR